MDTILHDFPQFAFSVAGALALLGLGMAVAVRIGLKPLLDSWSRATQVAAAEAERSQQDRRIALLEGELHRLHATVQGLVDAEEFRRQLQSRREPPTLEGGPPAPPVRVAEAG